MLRLCPHLAYFVSGRVDKKRLFYDYLNDYLVKLFFQACCVKYMPCTLFISTVFTLFLKALADTSGTCLSVSNSNLVTISNPLGNTEEF